MNKNLDLLTALKNLCKFSFPIICAAIINILPIIVSIWILSRLGKDHLAAAGIAAPTFFTIMTVFMMGFYAVGIKIGHNFGKAQKDPKYNDQVGSWVINGLALAAVLLIPAILVLFSIPSMLLFFRQDPHLVELSKPFFYYGALAIIPKMAKSVLNQYFVSVKHPKVSLYSSFITLPFIITLSYALILGKWGLPKLEMGGINCAAFIIDLFVVTATVLIIIFAKWSKQYNVFSKPLGFDYKRCIELFQLGWPISIQVGGELAAMTAMAYLLGTFGASALAAGQIVQQYILIFVMLSMGLGQGVAILISHAHGSDSLHEINTITTAGCIMIFLTSIIFAIGLLIFPKELVDIYLDIDYSVHNKLVDLAVYFMMIASLYITFDGIRGILTSSLRGIQDSKQPMRIGIIGLWLIGIPIAYISGITLHGGPVALRFGFVSGVAVATIILFFRYKKQLVLRNTKTKNKQLKTNN